VPTNASERDLSRMELAVLGLVHRGAPCTTYWIRRQFQASRSSYFSGSAGGVYPAVRRLERRQLVVAQERHEGRKRYREYRLTPDGLEVLEKWLSPPVPPEDIAFTMDPVRTRVFALDALPPRGRRRFVADALAKARRFASEVEAEAEEKRLSGDRFEYLGSLGIAYEARARVRWLEALLAELE
jgi:DNA-binding PadR family transcriptional regulator